MASKRVRSPQDPHRSQRDVQRHAVRLSGVTVPRETVEAVKERLEPGQTLSAAVREALEIWLAARASR
jgi:hypothetical protein